MEIWKKTQFDGYEASNLGRIRSVDKVGGEGRGNWSVRKGRVLVQRISRTGYPRINVMVSGKITTVQVHRMVCWAFHGAEPFDGAQVNHKDGNKENNTPENLEWCNQAHNNAHARETGLWSAKIGIKSKHTKYAYIGVDCTGNRVVLVGKKAIHEAGFVQAGVWRSERLGRFHHGYKFTKIPVGELTEDML